MDHRFHVGKRAQISRYARRLPEADREAFIYYTTNAYEKYPMSFIPAEKASMIRQYRHDVSRACLVEVARATTQLYTKNSP